MGQKPDRLVLWLAWGMAMCVLALVGAYVEVVLGWKGLGYGAIIGVLLYYVFHLKYDL